MKKVIVSLFSLFTFIIVSYCNDGVDTLTYAVFPYIPDAGYYQEIIEQRWAKIEPDIELVRMRITKRSWVPVHKFRIAKRLPHCHQWRRGALLYAPCRARGYGDVIAHIWISNTFSPSRF